MWGLLPHRVMQNANPRRAASFGSSHTQALLYRVSSMQELINTGTNSQGFLHISDLLLRTDLHQHLSFLSRWPMEKAAANTSPFL